jgi:hypothetical protein
MNDPLYDKLREAGWRRKLTAAEVAELRAWLAAHPERQSDWEAETALTDALARLSATPVSSNFTARVLARVEAIEWDKAGPGRRAPVWAWRWRSLVPKAAVSLVVVGLGLGLLSYHWHQAEQRAQIARRVAVASDVAALHSPELLQDFEVIRRLGQTPAADEELLALLQ